MKWYRANKPWKFKTRAQDIKRYDIKHATERRAYHRAYMRNRRAKMKLTQG